MRKQNIRGYSLLEFAASVAIVIPIIVSAVDVTNVLQAYNTVREATQITLRCLYPTDADCNKVQPSSAQPLLRYTARSATTQVQTTTYSGSLTFLGLPKYQTGPMQVKPLDEVVFQERLHSYERLVTMFPVMQKVQFGVEDSNKFPIITINDPNNIETIETQFRNPNFSKGFGPYRASLGGSKTTLFSLNSLNETQTEKFTFTFNTPFTAFKTCLASSETGGVQFSCFNYDGNGIRSVVHILGSLAHNGMGACGHVALLLDGIDIGGQTFTGPAASGNFVPRGLPTSSIQNISTAYPLEWTRSYNDSIYMWPGTKHTLTLTMGWNTSDKNATCRSGKHLEFEFIGVDVYFPTIKTVNKEVTCETPPISDCQNPVAACSIKKSDGIFPKDTFIDGPYRGHSVTGYKTCVGYAGAAGQSVTDLSAECSSILCNDTSGFNTISTSPDRLVDDPPIKCGPNRGVSENPDPDGFIRNSITALSVCPPTPRHGASLENIRWRDALNYIEVAPFKLGLVQSNCQESLLQGAAAYPEFTGYPSSKTIYGPAIYTGDYQLASLGKEMPGYEPKDDPNNPSNIVVKNNSYNCGIFKPITINLPGDPKSLPRKKEGATVFDGGDQVACAENHAVTPWLRTVAEEYFTFDPNTFFTASKGQDNWKSADNCGSDVHATSSCSPIIVKNETGSTQDLGVFVAGSTPAICNKCDILCRANLEGFTPGEDSESTTDVARATDLGDSVLEGYAPWVVTSCDGSSNARCGKVELPNINSRNENDPIVAKASITVPLVSPWMKVVFPEGSTTVSYSTHESPERKFARE